MSPLALRGVFFLEAWVFAFSAFFSLHTAPFVTLISLPLCACSIGGALSPRFVSTSRALTYAVHVGAACAGLVLMGKLDLIR